MMKTIALTLFATMLTACGGGKTDTSALKDGSFGPSTAECKAAQNSVRDDRATAGLWNGLGRTDWLGESCMLSVMFETGDKMLAFIDARLAEGRGPTVEVVLSGGRQVQVMLLLEVGGPIVAQGGSAGDHQDTAGRAWTMAQAKSLQQQLEDTGVFGTYANGLGITSAEAGVALDMTFEKNAGLRAYVADAVAKGVSPAPFYGKVRGKALYIPLLLEVVGEIVPQPTATVGN